METQQNHDEVIIGDVGGIDGGGGSIQSTSNSNDGSQIGQMYNFVTEGMSPSTISLSPSVSSVVVNRGRSKVWNEFQVTQDGKKVTCRQCGDSLSYSHSHSTSSMLKHLKRKHNMDLYPHVADEESLKQNSQVKALDKASKKSVKAKKAPQVMETTQTEEEYEPQPEPSIQHDPLMFADPCVRMRWADHSDTFLRTFSVMYNDESYTDCTLVADKQFFKAHRVILSSASELFDEMFKMTPPVQHPIIFLKDVKAMELRILLDFIYKGEVAIPPSLIPGLVKVGGELKVKGLSDFVWNEQLASSIFQGYQNMDNRQQPQQSQSQHSQQCLQTSTIQNNLIPSYTSTIPNSNITTTTGKIFNPVRTTTSMKQPITSGPSTSTFNYVSDKPCLSTPTPTTSGGTRTYTRVLSNVRAVNVLPNQNMGVNLGDGSTILNQGPSGLRRIRLISASSLPTSKCTGMAATSRFDGNMSDIGMECDTSPETVLMVTNHGETVLSTSQGGVTVMTPNSLSLPMGVAVKDERCINSQETHQHQLQTDHMNSHPITILSASGGTNSHDLEEVVYSITEVPGGGHEVLMSNAGETMDQESIVVYGTHQPLSISDSQDKKPFHLSLHKS